MLNIQPSSEPLERKIFNAHLDRLLETGKLNPEIIPYLDSWQMYAINEVKKSLIRLTNKK